MRFLRRQSTDDRIAEEIASHLSLLEDDYRRTGLSPEAARDAARRAFGGELKVRQLSREAGRWHWIGVLLQDARLGLRMLRRDRAFALTAVLVLGVGIGVNNMQFTIIYTHTLRALPIERAGRVLIGSLVDEGGVDRNVSYAEYQDLRPDGALIEELAAFGGTAPAALGDEGRAPDRHLAVYTTGNALDVLRIRPLSGRSFNADEERPGGPRVALLGGGAWRTRYASDPSIVGRDVLVDGKPTTIVGILPEESGFPSTAEIHLPVVQSPRFSPARDNRMLRVIARVDDGSSVDEALAHLSTLLLQAAGTTDSGARGLLPSVAPISVRFRGRATDPAWIAFYAVGFLVVAVACANAANLMLARGVHRAREMALRGSLGATRSRIVIQLLVESTVIAAMGAMIGLAVSLAGVRLFRAGVPDNAMPYWFRYSMDGTIFVALVVVSFATVLCFGLLPALQAARSDLAHVLKDGGRGQSGRRPRWMSIGFMVAQLGLSVVLLSYIVHDFVDEDIRVASDAVIEHSPIVTGTVNLPADRYQRPEQRASFFTELQHRLAALPGVDAAALASALPRGGGASDAIEQRLQVAGITEPAQMPSVHSITIGPAYFAALRVPLLNGRDFEDREASPVAIVNARFVETFSRDADPIGRTFTLSAQPPKSTSVSVTVVAVAQDIRQTNGRVVPMIYLPIAQAPPSTVSVMVRSAIDTAATTRQLRDAVLALDPNLPVHQVMTLDRVVREAGWNTRVSYRLVNVLATIVLVLSTIGLYAVTAHSVSHRAKEIAIRIAVGARPGAIRRLVLSGASLQIALGLGFGIVCTSIWDRLFSSGIAARHFIDPRVLAPIAVVLVAVMLLACVVPVRRAINLNPVDTLRQD